MNIGIVNQETWAFFNELFAEFKRYHTVSVFEPRQIKSPLFRERINRSVFQRNLEVFLRANQVVFFEWASELLAAATHLPKTTTIITRLHRYEMYHWVNHINWENVDRIILVSEAKRREFEARFPKQSEKLIVIPESISLDKFQRCEKKYNRELGILCNLTPRKRVYELVLAFASQGLVDKGFHLHIGGGEHPRFGDYYAALLEVVQKLGIQDQVTFHGRIEDAQAFYSKIDIFLSNSYNEGLQVSPMEAVASGCYCFSHWWAGAEELLPVENLYLTDSELSSRIITYDNLDEQTKIQKQNSLRQQIIEQFDAARISSRIRNLIEDTVRVGIK